MKLPIATLAMTLLATAFAQELQVDIPYQKFTLNNGLTVIVHEDHKAPIVAVNIWYHVGSKNEKHGKTGFAHLFEHLMFGGSEHVKSRIINAFEQVGATDLNGTTNNDRTNYFETVPVSALDYALFIESDRMGHLLGSFDKQTLDLQRGVVQNEKRQGENEPYGQVDNLMTESTFPAGHPYSWTVIGSMDDLSAASLEDVSEWFKTYYGPSNAVLSLAGDIDAKTAREKVEKYFGDLPAGPPVARHQSWIAKRTGMQRQQLQDRVPQARIYKVWNIPQYGATDTDYLDLVSDLLSQGKTSRLYKRLVYDDQIATNVQVYLDAREIAGQFVISATARPGVELAKVEVAIDQELSRFMDSGPSPEELQRVKTQFVANFVRGLERVGGFGGKSDVLAQNAVYTGNPEAYKASLANHANATAEDVRATAKRWLSDGVYVLEVLPFASYQSAGAGVDRSKLPEPGAPPAAKPPKIERATLSNGLKIMLTERHELPLVNLRLTLDAGYAADQLGTPGVARLACTMLTNGTATRSALQISDELRLLGAQLNAHSTLDRSIVGMSALRTRLDGSLALFADIVMNPTFPALDFEREKKNLLAAIEQEQAEPVTMALRVLPALIYGKSHAYGNPLTGSGTAVSVSKITREDLARFHQTWFHPNNGTLIVVGDTTLAEIKASLERQFANWKPASVPQKNLSRTELASSPSVYLIDRPGSEQSLIIAGHVAPPRNNPQEIAVGVLNDMIGGTFSSRLNMNLREDKHWAYGSFSLFFDAKGQSPFIAIAPVQTDKSKESIAEMNRELHEIVASRPVTETELKNLLSNRILSLPGSQETNDALGQAEQTIADFGFPDDYYGTYPGKLKALRTGDINDAAKSVVHPDSLIWVVVGDRVKIEQGIRELNLGEIKRIDADGKPLH